MGTSGTAASRRGGQRAAAYSRRRALQLGLVTGTALVGLTHAEAASAASAGPVFLHGVASGDPTPGATVIWTRVTPTDEALPGSGAGPVVPVAWEVAADPSFDQVVRQGSVSAGPARDHTVKVDVTGLDPATRYWYRFRCLGRTSRPGRTRTAPAEGAAVTRLRLAVVSCANLQAGWFSAYRHLAERDDLDLVVHLGDYFYEYGPGEYQARDVVVRPHDPPWEAVTQADYRRRHAQYKTDPDLQALHAAVPWVLTWDDHESANDAWAGGAVNHSPEVEGDWNSRRASAQRAYAEWMPVRYEPPGRMYRRFHFGRLASLSMLDLRSYRDQQVGSPTDPALADPGRSITGAAQEDFLLDGLSDRSVQWKLIGNPVMIAPVHPATTSTPTGTGSPDADGGRPVTVPVNLDQWDGYPAARAGVLAHLRRNRIRDAVFLTGDMHSAWAAELPADEPTYAATGAAVGVELVCTSVTSDNLADGLRLPPHETPRGVEAAVLAANPHVKHVDFGAHGFSVLDVTRERVQMDWFTLVDRVDPASAAVWSRSWQVHSGTSTLTRASKRLA